MFAAYADLPRVVQGVDTPIASLDPFSLTGIDSFRSTGNVIEPLAYLKPLSPDLEPKLATSWTFNPKTKSFRVKLREGVKFHNGQNLTAEDVKFTWAAYYKPEYQAGVWRGMWEDVAGIDIVDPNTIDVRLKNWHYPAFENFMTTLRVLPKSFYQPADKAKFQKEIVGTGHFQFARFEPNRLLELKPAAGAAPNFSLLIKHVADAKLAAEMIAKKELDFYELSPSQTEPAPAKNVKRVELKSGLGHGFEISLNWANPLFQSKKVRCALLKAWKREDLNRQVYSGRMHPSVDIFSPNTDFYPAGQPVQADLKAALQDLKDEGWRDTDKDSILDKNGKPFEFHVLVSSAADERWVTLFQRDMAAAGIRIYIDKVGEDPQWFKRLQDGKFDAVAGTGGLTAMPSSMVMHSKGAYNFGKFANPETDKLLEELDREFDPEKRRLISGKIITKLRDLCPLLPGLHSREQIFLTSERLTVDPQQPSRAWLWKLR